jgi:hypothetical protein
MRRIRESARARERVSELEGEGRERLVRDRETGARRRKRLAGFSASGTSASVWLPALDAVEPAAVGMNELLLSAGAGRSE